MKLLTQELLNRFKKLGAQDTEDESGIVVAKFFTPDAQWTWYAISYEPKERMFFGLVKGLEIEYGYFSLDELESVTGKFGLHVERDKWWKEMKVGEVRKILNGGGHV